MNADTKSNILTPWALGIEVVCPFNDCLLGASGARTWGVGKKVLWVDELINARNSIRWEW
jgi:hypothetical protein